MNKRYGPKSLAFFAATKVMVPMDDDSPSYSLERRDRASVFVCGMLKIICFGAFLLMIFGTIVAGLFYQFAGREFFHLPWIASIPLGLALTVVTGGALYWLSEKAFDIAFRYEYGR